jgi:hypothetical protein
MKALNTSLIEALKLYAEEQEDLECLAIIEAREHEPTISHDDMIQRLKADDLL